jgi:hypothetical protein
VIGLFDSRVVLLTIVGWIVVTTMLDSNYPNIFHNVTGIDLKTRTKDCECYKLHFKNVLFEVPI